MAELQEVLEKLDLVNDVKLEIKDVISTDSLHFEDYPNLIARHLVNTPTEQTIADRVTANGATIADGIAFIKTIKGNSLKWNQHYKSNLPSSYTQGGVTITSNADGSVSIVGQNTTGGTMYFPVFSATYPSGHKMLLIRGSNATLYDDNSTNRTTGSNYMICTSGASIALYHSVKVNVNYNETFIPLYFDLTEMGMEDVTSADQFAQRLGFASANELPSFPYDEGSIKNFSASQLMTKTNKVEIDLGSLSWYYSGGRFYNHPAVAKTPTAYDVPSNIICNAYTTTSPQGWYNKVKDKSISVLGLGYGGDGTIGIIDNDYTNATDFQAAMNGVMATIESPTELSTLDTLSLPSIELLSAGSAFDEYNLAEGKLTRRIEVVKLKDLDFSQYGADATGHSFFALLNDITGGDDNTKRNFLTREYITMSFVEAGILDSNKKDKVICGVDNAKRVIVRDTAFSSASAFKAHFTDDDVLYYEVVTPVTTDEETSKAYYKVENGGKETLARPSRNIWVNGDLLSGLYADGNKVVSSGGFYYKVVKVKPNTDYTLKVFGSFTDSLFCGFIASETPSAGEDALSFRVSVNYAETTNSGDNEYALIAVWRDYVSVLDTLMFEEGTTSHPYEQGGTSVLDTTSSPLKADIGYQS